MKKTILLSIMLITTGFLTATAQTGISIPKKYQGENAIFKSPNFETPKLPAIKKAKSGQDWWVPDTVYCFVHNSEREFWSFEHYYDSEGLFVLAGNTSSGPRAGCRFTYTYDSNHNLLSLLMQSWKNANNSWKNYYLYTYTYDSINNKLTKESLIWIDTNNSWENIYSYSYTYTYDSNNNLLTELQQEWRNDSWEDIQSVLYTYDSNNNRLTKRIQNKQNDSWVNLSLSTYTYDSSKNRLTDISQNWENNSWINSESSTFTYDSDHNLLGIIQQSWVNNTWENIILYAFTYDSNHNLLIELHQEWKNNSWVNRKQYLMTYDENMNGTSVESQIWINESWHNIGVGDPILWLYYNNMQSVFEGEYCDKITASYINVADFTAIKEPPATPDLNTISIYPNPTAGELRIENGELKIQQVSFFDISGIQVLSTQQTVLDISHLPAGVYFVQIKTEKGVVTKKVVKI